MGTQTERIVVQDGKGETVEDYQVQVTTSSSADNATSLRTQADQVIATLENATRTKATWDGLTAAQRQEFTRIGLLAVAKIARLVLGRLDSA